MEHTALILAVIFAIYELVIALKPTVKSWSILTIVMKFLRSFAPDKNKEGGTHEVK